MTLLSHMSEAGTTTVTTQVNLWQRVGVGTGESTSSTSTPSNAGRQGNLSVGWIPRQPPGRGSPFHNRTSAVVLQLSALLMTPRPRIFPLAPHYTPASFLPCLPASPCVTCCQGSYCLPARCTLLSLLPHGISSFLNTSPAWGRGAGLPGSNRARPRRELWSPMLVRDWMGGLGSREEVRGQGPADEINS